MSVWFATFTFKVLVIEDYIYWDKSNIGGIVDGWCLVISVMLFHDKFTYWSYLFSARTATSCYKQTGLKLFQLMSISIRNLLISTKSHSCFMLLSERFALTKPNLLSVRLLNRYVSSYSVLVLCILQFTILSSYKLLGIGLIIMDLSDSKDLD